MTALHLVSSAKSHLPPPRELSGAFSVESFLQRLSEFPVLGEQDRYRVDRLCKKVDVVGEVRAFYKPDLSRSVTKDKVGPRYIELMAAILLYYAIETHNPKLLNTVLKLADGTRSHAPVSDPVVSLADELVGVFCGGIVDGDG